MPGHTHTPDHPQLREVSIEEIWEILREPSPAKSTGTDGIPARLIKICSDTILEPLHYVFNMSINSRVFHNIWKQVD